MMTSEGWAMFLAGFGRLLNQSLKRLELRCFESKTVWTPSPLQKSPLEHARLVRLGGRLGEREDRADSVKRFRVATDAVVPHDRQRLGIRLARIRHLRQEAEKLRVA